MPPLTKIQQRLVDRVRKEGYMVILSKYERNPYLYGGRTASRISGKVINSLLDNLVFQSTRPTVEENEQVEMELIEYELQRYIEKRENEV